MFVWQPLRACAGEQVAGHKRLLFGGPRVCQAGSPAVWWQVAGRWRRGLGMGGIHRGGRASRLPRWMAVRGHGITPWCDSHAIGLSRPRIGRGLRALRAPDLPLHLPGASSARHGRAVHDGGGPQPRAALPRRPGPAYVGPGLRSAARVPPELCRAEAWGGGVLVERARACTARACAYVERCERVAAVCAARRWALVSVERAPRARVRVRGASARD